jgi:hypothetical protein
LSFLLAINAYINFRGAEPDLLSAVLRQTKNEILAEITFDEIETQL